MKINKYIKIIYMMTFMVLGLNGILGAALEETDRMKNEYIRTHIPVFVNGLVGSKSVDTCGTSYTMDPENWESTAETETGDVWLNLENAAENKYNLYVHSKKFLGYSDRGISVIQLKAKFEGAYGERNFGEPIPLKAGTYTREALIENNVGRYRATVEVSEGTMDIGIEQSGATRWTATYKPEKVFFVQIKDLQMIGSCSIFTGFKELK